MVLVLVWMGLAMLLMEVVLASVLMGEVFEVEMKMVVVGLMALVVGMKVYFQRLAGLVEYFEVESEEVPHYLMEVEEAFVVE